MQSKQQLLGRAKGIDDNGLLDELCKKYGIPSEVIGEMLEIENDHQLMERRHGIFQKLRETMASVSNGTNTTESKI